MNRGCTLVELWIWWCSGGHLGLCAPTATFARHSRAGLLSVVQVVLQLLQADPTFACHPSCRRAPAIFLNFSSGCHQWTHPEHLNSAHVLASCLALTVNCPCGYEPPHITLALHELLLGSSRSETRVAETAVELRFPHGTESQCFSMKKKT